MLIDDRQIIALLQDVATMRAQITEMSSKITKMEGEVDRITEMANRWRGVTAFLLGLGGLLGGAVALWGRIKGGA